MADENTEAGAKMAADQAPKSDPLKNLDARARKLVQDVMAHHPLLTTEEALEALKEAGGI
jgi:hypothetical protein